MKKLWRKWSYEIPLAIGDLLWEVLVVQFAAFLDRLTVRKVVEFVAIALLVWPSRRPCRSIWQSCLPATR